MSTIELPSMDFRVILQLAIVFGWGTALLLINLFIPAGKKRVTGYLAIAGLVVAAVAGIWLWTQQLPVSSFNDMVRLDTYGLAFNWLFLGVAIIAILISLDYTAVRQSERGAYYVLIMFSTAGMMLLAQGSDLVVQFLGLELLSITLYVLTGFLYPRVDSEEAGLKYLLIGAFASGFLVFGIALVYGATGLSNLAQIDEYLRRQTLQAVDFTLLFVGAALILVGFGYKVSMVPFHMWTPDVYQGAPTPITAFMSVGTKAAAFAALTRFLIEALGSQHAVWAPILAVLAALTMLTGNIIAIAQRNLKRMLAYSSIGHAGYLLMAPVAASNRGVEALLFYLVGYALANLGAFAFLVSLEQRGETTWDISEFTGLWARKPWLAIVMAISLLSLAGVPPTAGFVGKLFVIGAAWDAGFRWLAFVAIIASAIGAVFYIRVVINMFTRVPERAAHTIDSRSLQVVVGVIAAATLLLGLLPAPVLDLVQQSVLAIGR